jgi:hypothetical protein
LCLDSVAGMTLPSPCSLGTVAIYRIIVQLWTAPEALHECENHRRPAID